MSAEHIPYSNAPISPKAMKLLSQYLFEDETILWSGKPGFSYAAGHCLIVLLVSIFPAMFLLRIKTIMSGIPSSSFIITVFHLLLVLLGISLAHWLMPLVRYLCNAMIITDRRVFCIVPKSFSSLGLYIYEANELADRTVTRHPSGSGRIDIPRYALKTKSPSSLWTMANIDLAENFISQIVSRSCIDDNADILRTIVAFPDPSDIDKKLNTDSLTAKIEHLLDDKEKIQWIGQSQNDQRPSISPFFVVFYLAILIVIGVGVLRAHINNTTTSEHANLLIALIGCTCFLLAILFISKISRSYFIYAVTDSRCLSFEMHSDKNFRQISMLASRIDHINSTQTPNQMMNVLIKSTGDDSSLIFHNLKDCLEAENCVHNLSLQAADVTRRCEEKLNILAAKGHSIKAEMTDAENTLLNHIENGETILWSGKPSICYSILACLVPTLGFVIPAIPICILIGSDKEMPPWNIAAICIATTVAIWTSACIITYYCVRQTRYLITNKRFLSMTGIKRKNPNVKAKRANEIHLLHAHHYDKDLGTLQLCRLQPPKLRVFEFQLINDLQSAGAIAELVISANAPQH